jgi:hypothetical protein
MYVRLTCKQKIERDHAGEQMPAGIVKWFVEVFDQNDELTAVATILTMVQKRSPFIEINRDNINNYREIDREPQSQLGNHDAAAHGGAHGRTIPLRD